MRTALPQRPAGHPIDPFLLMWRRDGPELRLRVYRALGLPGPWDRARLRAVLRSLLAIQPDDREAFDQEFDGFFLADELPSWLQERLGRPPEQGGWDPLRVMLDLRQALARSLPAADTGPGAAPPPDSGDEAAAPVSAAGGTTAPGETSATGPGAAPAPEPAPASADPPMQEAVTPALAVPVLLAAPLLVLSDVELDLRSGARPEPFLPRELDHLAYESGLCAGPEHVLLDLAATVRATAGQGGLLQPVYRSPLRVSHLSLVLPRVMDEVAEALTGALISGLRARGVPVQVLHGGPRGDRPELVLLFLDASQPADPPWAAWLSVGHVALVEVRDSGLWGREAERLPQGVFTPDFAGLSAALRASAQALRPAPVSGTRRGPVRARLTDTLRLAAACALAAPCDLGTADALRRRFTPHLPFCRLQRIARTEGVIADADGWRFSAELTRWLVERIGPQLRLEVLRWQADRLRGLAVVPQSRGAAIRDREEALLTLQLLSLDGGGDAAEAAAALACLAQHHGDEGLRRRLGERVPEVVRLSPEILARSPALAAWAIRRLPVAGPQGSGAPSPGGDTPAEGAPGRLEEQEAGRDGDLLWDADIERALSGLGERPEPPDAGDGVEGAPAEAPEASQPAAGAQAAELIGGMSYELTRLPSGDRCLVAWIPEHFFPHQSVDIDELRRTRNFEADPTASLKTLIAHLRAVSAPPLAAHPTLVRALHCGWNVVDPRHTRVAVAMEPVDGVSLAQLQDQPGGVPQEQALHLVRQLATVLALAHERDCPHLDLQPGHVMVIDDPEVPGGKRARLLGLGVASAMSAWTRQRAGSSAETRRLLRPWSACYTAPEVLFQGEHAGTTASDVYSLSAILYVLLHGREGERALKSWRSLYSQISIRPSLPGKLQVLLTGMLSREPDARPGMAFVARALEDLGAPRAVPIRARAGQSGPATPTGERALEWYELGREIGSGRLARVQEAVSLRTWERVAIKRLRPEVLESSPSSARAFADEARTLQQLRHPGIVSLLQTGMIGACPILVLELLKGESLAQRIKWRGISVPFALRAALQVATTLDFVHALDIVHRGLSPLDLFVVPDPEVLTGERVKLLDFDLARPMSQAIGAAFAGVPAYAAPEQQGPGLLTGACDVYALGGILYEMLTGRPPFTGSRESVLRAHLTQTPPALKIRAPLVDPVVADLVHRMLARAPADRPLMAEIANTLLQFMIEEPTTAAPEVP